MKKQFEQPVYICCDASGYYTRKERKDRFCVKYTYLVFDQLIEILVQDNGRPVDAYLYFEHHLN